MGAGNFVIFRKVDKFSSLNLAFNSIDLPISEKPSSVSSEGLRSYGLIDWANIQLQIFRKCLDFTFDENSSYVDSVYYLYNRFDEEKTKPN